MDFITIEFQKKEQDNRSKDQGMKCGLDERIQLRGGESRSEKKKSEFVPKEVCDKRKIKGRCMKCGRSKHQALDCKAPSQAKTPPSLCNANQKHVQKKRKFDRGHVKITELSSEEDSGNQ